MLSKVYKEYKPFIHILLLYILFIPTAFLFSSPKEIANGIVAIVASRSLLITDYIAVGGLGAAMINAAISGTISVIMMLLAKVKPNGALIMAIWLSTGFAFFGKNPFNTIPITFGVWLYSRFQKEPFANYSLVAVLCGTLAPVVSEFTFMGRFSPLIELLIGTTVGITVGFFLPIISAATNKVHNGYNLYNIGFAGGVLSIFLISFSRSFGIEITQPLYWSTGNNLKLAIFLYSVMVFWILLGHFTSTRKKLFTNWKKIFKHSGRLVTDYYLLYGSCTYLNMGVLGILGITVTLLLGADLNGATIAGIFCMTGFGAFGKHPLNCIPVMAGSITMAFINHPPHSDPGNITAVLFCTALAPIAGQYGWVWGFIAGLLHDTIVSYAGQVTGGLNLYNNGFAAGFVALVLVPIIIALKRGFEKRESSL